MRRRHSAVVTHSTDGPRKPRGHIIRLHYIVIDLAFLLWYQCYCAAQATDASGRCDQWFSHPSLYPCPSATTIHTCNCKPLEQSASRDRNPLTPTVAIMSTAITHLVSGQVKPSFVIFDIRALWRSEVSVRVPGCQNYKWRLNPAWHKMRYSCTHNSGRERVNVWHSLCDLWPQNWYRCLDDWVTVLKNWLETRTISGLK